MRKIPDLIISDVMMEGMNGFELCKAIKENINTSHIPVMLLTAYALDEQRVTGFQSGADAYIPKPFNEELLVVPETILEEIPEEDVLVEGAQMGQRTYLLLLPLPKPPLTFQFNLISILECVCLGWLMVLLTSPLLP